jgi:hypothetical protein
MYLHRNRLGHVHSFAAAQSRHDRCAEIDQNGHSGFRVISYRDRTAGGGMSATERVSIGSYLIGVFTGTLIQLALVAIDAVGRNPDAGFLLVAFPIALLFWWLLNGVIGLLPFLLLRNVSPNKAFVIAILAPIISFLCLTCELWIASPASRPDIVISEYWPLILAITFIGGAACWLFDQMRRR